MRNKIDQCFVRARETNRLSLAIIGSTAKAGNPSMLIAPDRESSKFVACCFIVSDKSSLQQICEYADGKMDYIFIDAEAKTAEAGDFLAAAGVYVKKSKLKSYKGNDITALACDVLVNELLTELSGKKVSIIGAGNLGSKTALKLAERGAQVYITRRDDKGAAIAETLNAIMPRYTSGRIINENNVSISADRAHILIGFTQGEPIIDSGMINELDGQAIVIDGGIGTLTEAAITAAHHKGLTIMRLDVRIAFAYVLDAILDMEYFMKHVAGSRTIDGKQYVAGGVIGEKNDIVVHDIRDPHDHQIGVADGRGGIIR